MYMYMEMARVFILLCLAVTLFSPTSALYEDQVGLYDWYRQYVGPVSYVSIDHTNSMNRGIVVASETGVLALVDAYTGEIAWRRVFASGESGRIDSVLRTNSGLLLTVSNNGRLISSWDINTGTLKWEVATPLVGGVRHGSYSLSYKWTPGAAQTTITRGKPALVVVAAGGNVSAHSLRNGEIEWTQSLDLPEHSLLCTMYTNDDSVFLVSAEHGSVVTITTLSFSGELVSRRELQTPWFSPDSSQCLVTKTRVVCLVAATQTLYHVDPIDDHFITTHLSTLLKLSPGTPLLMLSAGGGERVWLKGGAESEWLLSVKGSEVEIVSTRKGVSLSVRNLLVQAEGTTLLVNDRAFDIGQERGMAVGGAVQASENDDQYKLVLLMEDHSILLLNQNELLWSREDGLGALVTMETLDLPAGQSEKIEAFVESTKSENNPLKLAALRLQLQITLAKEFLSSLNLELLQFDNSSLVRDQFNTRKLLITTTAHGKLYGLDSSNGNMLWQLLVPRPFSPFNNGRPLLFILRTTSHPPHSPRGILIGQSQGPECVTVVQEFNPLTGVLGERACLPDHVIQTLLLPALDESHSRVLLLLTDKNKVITYPPSAGVHSLLSEDLFLLVADEASITGYQVVQDQWGGMEVELFWQVHFPADSERVVAVEGKRTTESVSSLGDVLADRSVQYKYLNPNLVAVVTESLDKSKIGVYLVDRVTGGIVYHTAHKNAVGPVHITHSENWIIYQYLNTKQRRHELAVLELYESHTNHSDGAWSSLAPPPLPTVTSQAYAFPFSIQSLSTTQTLRGITFKSLLFGLHSGRVVMLPKSLLSPRRQLEVTDQMKEEGIPPYQPEMSFPAQAFINYNRTVARIQDIYTIPSGLESTCLLLVYGLDLFYTRVTPSKQFDLLADDFDYTLISGVLVAMLLGTVVLSRLSARKTLNSLWK